MIQQLSTNIQRNVGNPLVDAWYTTNYKYRKFFQYEVQHEGYILGDEIHDSQHLQQVIQNICWFTYRRGFQPYYCDNIECVSDVGWGCMIRVGQMMMAELIKKHYYRFFGMDIMKYTELRVQLIQMFMDNDDYESNNNDNQIRKYPFSIQNIMRLGYQELEKKPGQWYSPNQIINILELIIKQSKIDMITGMKLIPIYDNSLDITSIITEMCLKYNCSCIQKKMDFKALLYKIEQLCTTHGNKDEVVIIDQRKKYSVDLNHQLYEKCRDEFNKLCHKCFQPQRAISICLLSRIGCDSPNMNYINLIRSLMKKSYFCGILGGRPSQANFIVGFSDDKFIALDPHLVQDSFPPHKIHDFFYSCFTPNAMFIKDSEIDCSCGLVFYFKDFDDLTNLLIDIYSEGQDCLFFSVRASKVQIKEDKSQKYIEDLEKHRQKLCKIKEEKYDEISFYDSTFCNSSSFYVEEIIRKQSDSYEISNNQNSNNYNDNNNNNNDQIDSSFEKC